MPSAAAIADATLPLAGTFLGQLVQPADATYDETRRVHNRLIDKRPALIACCRGTADVVDAVNLAHKLCLEVAVRGGGHNVAGRSAIDEGLMIDLSPMRGVHVDPADRTARAQGGRSTRNSSVITSLKPSATCKSTTPRKTLSICWAAQSSTRLRTTQPVPLPCSRSGRSWRSSEMKCYKHSLLATLFGFSLSIALVANAAPPDPPIPASSPKPPVARAPAYHQPPTEPEYVPPAVATPSPPPFNWCAKAASNPSDASAHAACLNGQAWDLMKGGNPTLALTYINQAVQLEPSSPYHWDTAGQVSLALGQTDQAMRDFDQAIALGGNFAITFLGRGRIFESRGDRDRAIVEYMRALQAPASDEIARTAQQQARARLQSLGRL
jgi:hypothetical protein